MKVYLIFSISLIFLLTLLYYMAFRTVTFEKNDDFDKNPYIQDCIDLYKKLRYPDKELIILPPAQKPPAHMMDDFTMNGQMPMTYYYINEAYSDSASNDKSKIQEVITSSSFNYYLKRVRNNEPLSYGDRELNRVMHSYSNEINGKTVAVVGTATPWVEAIAYDVGASLITTLEYTRKKYELTSLKWVHVNDYLDEHIEKRKFQHFDVIVSFSSIEHAGLGRFGDPLSPNGDVDAVKQIDCMLKPGGLFFLGLPTSKDGSSSIAFNAHRIYGKLRLDLLLKGWTVLNQTLDSSGLQTIFILKKAKIKA